MVQAPQVRPEAELQRSAESLSPKQLAFFFHEGIPEWTLAMNGSIEESINLVRYKAPENTNLLVKEKGDEPNDRRERRSHSAGEKIRVVLQELVVAEQVGKPFRRTRKPSPNEGSVPETRSFVRGKLGGPNELWGPGKPTLEPRQSNRQPAGTNMPGPSSYGQPAQLQCS